MVVIVAGFHDKGPSLGRALKGRDGRSSGRHITRRVEGQDGNGRPKLLSLRYFPLVPHSCRINENNVNVPFRTAPSQCPECTV